MVRKPFKISHLMIAIPFFYCLFIQFSWQEKKADNNNNNDKLKLEVISAVKKGEIEEIINNVRTTGSNSNGEEEKNIKVSVRLVQVGKNKQADPLDQEEKNKQADAYYSTANYYCSVSRYNIALGIYERALLLYRQVNDLVGQGDVYHSKGEIYFRLGNNPDAEAMLNKALLMYSKGNSFVGQGNASKSLGDFFLRTGEYQKAHDMYRKALACYVKGKALLGQGNAYQGEGEAYLMEENYSAAFKNYKKALDFYIKTKSALGQGNIYMGIGTVYGRTGKIEDALKMYHKALDFYRMTDDTVGPSYIYSYIGNIYLRRGKIAMAIEVCEGALKNFAKIGDLLGQGNMCEIKGDIFLMTTSMGKALEMYERALYCYQRLKSPISIGNVYRKKGDIYLWAEKFSKAWEMYKNAVAYYVEIDDSIGQGNVCISIGNIFMLAGKSKKAMEMYNQALVFFKKVNNVIGIGNTYIKIGDTHIHQGDIESALRVYDKAMLINLKTNSLHAQGSIYYGKAHAHLKKDDKKNAKKMFEESRKIFADIRFTDAEAYAVFWLAKIFHMLDENQKAFELYVNGINLFEKVRDQTIFPGMKMSFMEKSYDIYEDAIHFMLNNKDEKRAFQVAELMRARVFLEALSRKIRKVDKGLSPEMAKKRDKLVSKVSVIKNKLAFKPGKNKKEHRKELDQAEMQLEDLYVEIRRKYPLYSSVFNPKLAELENIRQKVLKNDELLLEYFASKEGVYVFLVSREDFQVKKLDASIGKINDPFNKCLNEYLKSINEYSSQKRKSYRKENKMIENLESLYSFLLQPVEEKIEGKKLIFAPDAQLAVIPFEALVTGRDKKTGKPVFLIEKYSIKYIQGASVLATLRSRSRGELSSDNLVAFGDPVYDYQNFKLGKPEKGDHRRLPRTGEEVEAIANVFREMGHSPVVYLRNNASETNAKSSVMNRFGYIHFACHGISRLAGKGISRIGFQSLVLSQKIPDEKEDGYFALNEIMNCDYNAKLVVLSGCETNLGKLARGEGVLGLLRAVMYAGTPAAVASLWTVKDKAAKKLMIRFYKNLLEKRMDKSEALRKAKLEMIKNKTYVSPFIWSAFVMYGE